MVDRPSWVGRVRNARCSTRCAMPSLPAGSLVEPTPTTLTTPAMGELWSSWTMMRSPLASLKSRIRKLIDFRPTSPGLGRLLPHDNDSAHRIAVTKGVRMCTTYSLVAPASTRGDGARLSLGRGPSAHSTPERAWRLPLPSAMNGRHGRPGPALGVGAAGPARPAVRDRVGAGPASGLAADQVSSQARDGLCQSGGREAGPVRPGGGRSARGAPGSGRPAQGGAAPGPARGGGAVASQPELDQC